MHSKVTGYALVSDPSLVGLWQVVNQRLEEGWIPIGGIVIDTNGCYIQTMVKVGEDDGES